MKDYKAKFIKGMRLSKLFYKEVVRDIIEENFSYLKYSAGLIGSGSEVLGYDTPESTDHHWGPRVMIFLEEKDYNLRKDISKVLSERLPGTFRGFSTHFGNPDEIGVQLMIEAEDGQQINHRVEFFTIKSFFSEELSINPFKELKAIDWIIFSEQRLNTIRKGKFFHDELHIGKLQKKFHYYPEQVWYYLLASEWKKIGQEEPLVGRCWSVGDELGAKLIVSRIIQAIIRLCFYMEKEYAPYSKWLGTAFKDLDCSDKLLPILSSILKFEEWDKIEDYLSKAYEFVASMHNDLSITEPLPQKAVNFYDRPYRVIRGGLFAESIRAKITDKEVLSLPPDVGSVSQFSNSVDLLSNNELLEKLRDFYV